MTEVREVDARGLACPMPIVKLAAAIRDVPDGEGVHLLATDPAVEGDLLAWCAATGHTLLHRAWAHGVFRADVRKERV